jgi:glycosyltransferase involved in cell wall biosynthesis
MIQPLKVCIVWHGLPAYAARLVCSVVNEPNIAVRVFATKSPEDPRYLEQIIGSQITWVDEENARDVAKTIDADVYFLTGWAFDVCRQFASVAKAQGKPVVAMIDNRWRGDLRQRLGSVYFRLALRSTIDFAWVPGESATRLCRTLGFPADAVIDSLYGGDGTVFTLPVSSADRPPRIGFVGQMIRRKGFDLLVEAFKRFHRESPEYELHAYGTGELSSLAVGVPGVVMHPFAKPGVIAEAMRNFRVFVMPSRDDNWPLAVHEAALSGCALVTTRNVGNAGEFVDHSNGIVISELTSTALTEALTTVASWPEETRRTASGVSRRLAEPFGPARWRKRFFRLCAAATAGRWAPSCGSTGLTPMSNNTAVKTQIECAQRDSSMPRPG